MSFFAGDVSPFSHEGLVQILRQLLKENEFQSEHAARSVFPGLHEFLRLTEALFLADRNRSVTKLANMGPGFHVLGHISLISGFAISVLCT
jgi:hypothetical protein